MFRCGTKPVDGSTGIDTWYARIVVGLSHEVSRSGSVVWPGHSTTRPAINGSDYTTNQASYDLARLRLNGLIARIPGKNRYRLTGDGLRFAIFYTKLHDRLLRPLLAADQPPAPPPLRKALRTIDTHIAERIENARLLLKAA